MEADLLYRTMEEDVKGQGLFYDYQACPCRRKKLWADFCHNRCQLRTACQQHTQEVNTISNDRQGQPQVSSPLTQLIPPELYSGCGRTGFEEI